MQHPGNEPRPTLRELIAADGKSVGVYLLAFVKWLLIGGIIGLVGGLVGIAFHELIALAVGFRASHSWVIYLLPVGGIVIALLYQLVHAPITTDNVLRAVRTSEPIHPLMAPLIFISTVITQFLGGSAGREGAAIQIGGCIGYQVGRLLRLDQKDSHVIVMCGISAVFSAVFSTPLAAAFFAMEVISIGTFYYAALIPCVTAAITANALSSLLGIEAEQFASFVIPAVSPASIGLILVLSALCAGVSIVFCSALHHGEQLIGKALPNPFVRVIAGGLLLIGLTKLVGTTDYNGAGMDLVQRAVAGDARPAAFALKILFTVLTISCGFKGGEIVPSMCVGATLGCVFGSLTGLDPGFCAAVGLVALFCCMVNCPVASLLIGLELFGAEAMQYFAVACAVSYLLSGNFGLYGSQKILYSKLKAEYIDAFAHH